MKKQKGIIDSKTELIQRKYKQRLKNSQSTYNINNITPKDYSYQAFQNMQKMKANAPFEDIYLGSGEMEDQIQSYKEQLIDAKLKNIKLTNEVQKLKELSKTQMTKFYNPGINNTEEGEEIQNQTESLFYKNSKDEINERMKKMEEKYEKKINKYHDKIKALKEHNTKLEDLVLKLKDTLDRANEVFPNFLMQLSNNNNNNGNNNNININENKKENPLMVSGGVDPINNNTDEQHIKLVEENRQLGSENLELKNVIAQYEEEIENMKNEKSTLNNDFDNKLKLIQKEMEMTNQKNEEILNNKIEEFNKDIIKKQKEIDSLKLENNELKKENQQYILQISTLTEEAQQHMEEKDVLEEQIKNNEYLLEDKNNKDNIIEELNSEIEKYRIENDEMKNEHNNIIEEYENQINGLKLEINNLNENIQNNKIKDEDNNNKQKNKIEEYENKIKLISNENNTYINQIKELKLEINNLNNIIKNNKNENDISMNKLKIINIC